MKKGMIEEDLNRRNFLRVFSVALAASSPLFAQSRKEEIPTAAQVQSFLKSLDGGWVDWERTVDTFKSGSPATQVKGIAVAWMPYIHALEKALELGCNLFVTHEPTYFNHRDNDPEIFRFPAVEAKRKFIQDKDLTIIRCHDVWDQYPGIGIPSGWGKLLDLGDPIDGSGYYFVFDGKGRTAKAIARQIAAKTAGMGQPGVQFIGPKDATVNRIALGTGAITPMFHFIEELKADMAICVDDDFVYWRDGAFAIDCGFPVAIVNHPVSEEYSMKLLAEVLQERFPQVPVHHIPERCMYELINAG